MERTQVPKPVLWWRLKPGLMGLKKLMPSSAIQWARERGFKWPGHYEPLCSHCHSISELVKSEFKISSSDADFADSLYDTASMGYSGLSRDTLINAVARYRTEAEVRGFVDAVYTIGKAADIPRPIIDHILDNVVSEESGTAVRR